MLTLMLDPSIIVTMSVWLTKKIKLPNREYSEYLKKKIERKVKMMNKREEKTVPLEVYAQELENYYDTLEVCRLMEDTILKLDPDRILQVTFSKVIRYGLKLAAKKRAEEYGISLSIDDRKTI